MCPNSQISISRQRAFGFPEAVLCKQEVVMCSCHSLPLRKRATLNSGVSCSRHIVLGFMNECTN